MGYRIRKKVGILITKCGCFCELTYVGAPTIRRKYYFMTEEEERRAKIVTSYGEENSLKAIHQLYLILLAERYTFASRACGIIRLSIYNYEIITYWNPFGLYFLGTGIFPIDNSEDIFILSRDCFSLYPLPLTFSTESFFVN